MQCAEQGNTAATSRLLRKGDLREMGDRLDRVGTKPLAQVMPCVC